MSEQIGVRASFMRGGTSKGLFFRWEDLPDERDAFLCAAMGSPDTFGRQLDGMGGGVSSLSKAMLVRRSERLGVDVDYLFAQVEIGQAGVDYAGNCGNLSSAVGCFAVDQGLVQLPDGPGVVRMFNENTSKRIDCHLELRGGRAAVSGGQEIAGVSGQGAAIRLDFLAPGGAGTGELLPTGLVIDWIEVGGRRVQVSVVDAANPCAFVNATDMGTSAALLPQQLASQPDLMAQLEDLRQAAARAAGMVEAAAVPKIALVSRPADFTTLSGETVMADSCDVLVRMISMGQPHLAIPLTGAMCSAVAARVSGSVVHGLANGRSDAPLRIGTASGVVPAMAEVAEGPTAVSASVYRTARTLMEGTVYAPVAQVEAIE